MLERFPTIPFWPQMVKRDAREDMSIQFTEGLPLLEIDEQSRSLTISSTGERESALVTFYEHYLADDLPYFAISRNFAPGLYEIIEKVKREAETFGPFIKGHSVGPVTFAAGVKAGEGRSLFQEPDLLDAMVKGLSIKALWQVKELARTGKRPIIFLDEPYLSGFGSAFSPIQRDQVVKILREIVGYLKERSDALVGIHCCGNTDWPMILEAEPDIVSFDAYEYLDYFLLYPEDLSRFLENGGTIAWGIVPTFSFTGTETVDTLLSILREGLDRLHRWGLDPELTAAASLLTPACGMGTMDPASAMRALELLEGVTDNCGALIPAGVARLESLDGNQ
ncbi:MAG: hypothetical protein JRJ78_03555 [Deltaproteobacteria bacterium]|nr:hypothetical protein [Deltaproteobacteria bacterium]MBW2303487.1 hypothetical protein [Deltaproteobacteria bacterium]